MRVDPIPGAGATNDDLARGLNQVHACFEGEKKLNAAFRKQVRGKMRAQEVELQLVARALLGEPGQRRGKPPKVAAMSGWQLGWRVAVGVGGGFTAAGALFRAWLALEPYLAPALKALVAAMAAGRI